MTYLVVGVAVGLAVVVVGLAIWLIPRWQVDRWRRAGISNEEKLAELGVQARTNVTQALGGLALIVTIAITAFQVNEGRRSADRTEQSAVRNLNLAAKNLALAEQGQVSERFSRAVEQLGATDAEGKPATDVRTGALFSLMRIGIDSESNRQQALLVVATYVRKHFAQPRPVGADGCKADFDFTQAQPDIVNALGFVLHRIAARLDKEDLLGLRGARLNGLALDGLNLNRFNLMGIKFRSASLNRAHFRDARLSFADFGRACLIGADFRGASLKGANFRGAKLRRADLERAPLSNEQQRQVVVVP